MLWTELEKHDPDHQQIKPNDRLPLEGYGIHTFEPRADAFAIWRRVKPRFFTSPRRGGRREAAGGVKTKAL
jgi:hypothetical protein